jgi:hypothetical protein
MMPASKQSKNINNVTANQDKTFIGTGTGTVTMPTIITLTLSKSGRKKIRLIPGQCAECGIDFITDPTNFHSGSRSRLIFIPDPGLDRQNYPRHDKDVLIL